MCGRLLILLTAIFATAGCARTVEDRLVGVWSMDRERSTIPEIPPAITAATGIDPEQFATNVFQNTRLKLLSDHTFVLLYTGAVEGTWRYEKGELVLSPSQKSPSPLFRSGKLTAKVEEVGPTISITRSTPIGDVVLRLRKSG